MFPQLIGLLNSGRAAKTLRQIAEAVLGGINPAKAIERVVRSRLGAQFGRSAGKTLGRAVCERIDAAMDAKQATVDDRVKIGTELGKNAAEQLAQAAEFVLTYGKFQEAVVRAKEVSDSEKLKTARTRRNAATQAVKQALIDVARVANGRKPRDAQMPE